MRPRGAQVIAEFINCKNRELLKFKNEVEKALVDGIEYAGLSCEKIEVYQFEPHGVTAIAVISESHVGLHTFPEANHMSLDIYTCSPDFGGPMKLYEYLKKQFDPATTRVMKIVRGNPMTIEETDWIMSFSSYGFETRYHVKKRLLSMRSDFQQIDIIENEEFGRMMFLDNDLQISECDLEDYNRAMLSDIKGEGEYVAILGGGDGGLLTGVLEKNPKKAVLIDIDKEVIEASKKFMKALTKDSFEDPKVEVVIDDVNKYLDGSRKFDSIVYDLTMHPEHITTSSRKIFLEGLFGRISKSLNKGGVISMHCCAEYDKETRKALESILPKYFRNIKFKTELIPSFVERWVFASGVK